ncbi:MAG TPA: acetate kinase, partial [Campylobacteraceae bacterium]|nr:acetate kinase [Campylobacteraceae bacterium]
LGNGASVTAVEKGRSIDTSMGMTPLEGLVMGTRCGDLDPGIVLWLCEEKGMDARDVDTLLNRRSGLKGLCGTNDMRRIVERMEEGDAEAAFAFRYFCRRVRKYIGAYMVLLGSVDAIVFSGGIGAHSREVREEVCRGLECFGMEIDTEKNRRNFTDAMLISGEKSRIVIAAIETDEEWQMAYESRRVLPECHRM